MLIQKYLGKNPQERFDNIKSIYAKLGVNAKFKKFNGDHSSIFMLKDDSDRSIVIESVKEFISEIIDSD